MSSENKEFFAGIKPIKYNPQAPVDDVLVFKHYNQDEVILGKPMHEWLRFAVCYWHTFRGLGADIFGAPTFERPWEQQQSDPMTIAKSRLRAAFEFYTKLGIKYFTFHDRDIAPEGETIEETEKNLDEIVQLAKQLQKETGIKCLWGTANLFSNPRYMNGAATNPDAHVFAYAAAQVKK
jgi:xylose isomerase